MIVLHLIIFLTFFQFFVSSQRSSFRCGLFDNIMNSCTFVSIIDGNSPRYILSTGDVVNTDLKGDLEFLRVGIVVVKQSLDHGE